jgi:hypothetical protein
VSLQAINNLERKLLCELQAVLPKPAYERSVEHDQAVAHAILACGNTH